MMFLGWWVGRSQRTSEDYYVAGRRLGWPLVGVSTMATQLSAVSFLSAPAFVGLRPGGGLIWLGYELAVPLAMMVLMVVLYPVFISLKIVSIYEFLEKRYDIRVRELVSLIFQIGSAFYGPIFAVFLIGILTRRARPLGAILGITAGVGLNLCLWIFAPSVSWLWWNAFGFFTTGAVIIVFGGIPSGDKPLFKIPREKRIWRLSYLLLVVYAVILTAFLTLLPCIYGANGLT